MIQGDKVITKEYEVDNNGGGGMSDLKLVTYERGGCERRPRAQSIQADKKACEYSVAILGLRWAVKTECNPYYEWLRLSAPVSSFGCLFVMVGGPASNSGATIL